MAKYIITYDANGGIGAVPSETIISSGYHTFASGGFSYNGRTLLGWSKQKDGPVDYGLGESTFVNVLSDRTIPLYAKWEGIETTVTYQLSFSESSVPTQSATSNASTYTFTIPSTIPTRSGYTFIGWSGGYYPGDKITIPHSSPSKYLSAEWSDNKEKTGYCVFNIYLDNDSLWWSGSCSQIGWLTLPSAGPQKSGFTCAGFATSKGATSATYGLGQMITGSSAPGVHTLYPVWVSGSSWTIYIMKGKDGSFSVSSVGPLYQELYQTIIVNSEYYSLDLTTYQDVWFYRNLDHSGTFNYQPSAFGFSKSDQGGGTGDIYPTVPQFDYPYNARVILKRPDTNKIYVYPYYGFRQGQTATTYTISGYTITQRKYIGYVLPSYTYPLKSCVYKYKISSSSYTKNLYLTGDGAVINIDSSHSPSSITFTVDTSIATFPDWDNLLAGQNISRLTAASWLKFTTYLNTVSNLLGLSTESYETPIQYYYIYASEFNKIVNQLNIIMNKVGELWGVQFTQPLPPKHIRGDKIIASDFVKLANAYNGMLKPYVFDIYLYSLYPIKLFGD